MTAFSAIHVMHRQRGLSLVEVMVAMTVGLVLVLGLGTLLVNSSRSFKAHDEFARMQDNAAFALNSLGNDLRTAGYYGYSMDLKNIETKGIVMVTDCGGNWALNFREVLSGFYNLTPAQANANLNCIDPDNFVNGGAVLVMRGVDGSPLSYCNMQNNLLYLRSDAKRGVIASGAQFMAETAQYLGLDVAMANCIAMDAGDPTPRYAYQARAYYLRPCSRPASGVCAATDDDGNPVPTLVKQELSDNLEVVEMPVAEGVEAWSVLYGVDASDDGVPEIFIPNPSATQFEQVVAVRVAVLVRSIKPVPNHDDSSKSYDLDGDGVTEFTCTPTVDCNYTRQVYSQTIQLRNIAQKRAANT